MDLIREETKNHPISGPLTRTVWYRFDEQRFSDVDSAISALRSEWTYDKNEYPEIETIQDARDKGVAVPPDITYESEVYDPHNPRHSNIKIAEKINETDIKLIFDKIITNMDSKQIEDLKQLLNINTTNFIEK